jgi:two-component system, response regulator PdtaR
VNAELGIRAAECSIPSSEFRIEMSESSMKRLKIIVADDESIMRLGLKAMLSELGHEPFLASNGREALNLARTIDADLALLDINMPMTDGLEAAKVIAKKHPMPIIFLTAYGQQELIETATALPIHGYLIKPVNERDLAAAIGVALARFNEQQQALRDAQNLRADLETRKIVDRAKGMLIDHGMKENEAYQYIQRKARDNRSSMREVAEKILAEGQKT